MNTNEYETYLKRQWKDIDRVYELKLFSKHVDIIDIYLNKISSSINIRDLRILCIGARYGIEIMAFEQLGFNIEMIDAIDIYPRNEKIIKADMHDLPFDDNLYDIVYSHHSIDHSLFPNKAIFEIKRVSKESATWIFTIPFDDYGREESIDFDSGDEILEFIKQYKPDNSPKYYLEVSRNKAGLTEPAEAWLPKGWKNELRLII